MNKIENKAFRCELISPDGDSVTEIGFRVYCPNTGCSDEGFISGKNQPALINPRCPECLADSRDYEEMLMVG